MQAQHETAYAEWEGGLQRELVHAASFAPDEKHRAACDKVWREFEKLIRRVYALDHVPPDSSRLEDAKQRYEEAFGETSYSLDELVEQLGGPKTIPRESYTLELRGEGGDGLRELD